MEDCGPQAACFPQCVSALRAAYAPRPRGWGHLLSVYTHASPSWGGYQEGSPFRGTMIKGRIPTAWGTHSLMEAARRLVQAAVADPANAWFVLASETAVPLYSPLLLWQQLAHESLSRIDACTSNVSGEGAGASGPLPAWAASSLGRSTGHLQHVCPYCSPQAGPMHRPPALNSGLAARRRR